MTDGAFHVLGESSTEPQVGIEPTTARLRIECSTPELLWRRLLHALARIRTATPCGTTPSRWRVYQFHHQGNSIPTGPTGLEPATSRVTVECSNQTELRPLSQSGLRDAYGHHRSDLLHRVSPRSCIPSPSIHRGHPARAPRMPEPAG